MSIEEVIKEAINESSSELTSDDILTALMMSEWSDTELIRKGLENNAPWEYYRYGNKLSKDKLLIGLRHKANSGYYKYGSELSKELLMIGAVNKAPNEYYKHASELSNELLIIGAIHQAPPAYYNMAKELDKELLITGATNYAQKDYYDYIKKLINRYGENIKPVIKHHVKNVKRIKLLPQEYADKIRKHLTRSNAIRIIDLTSILVKQQSTPLEVTIKQLTKQVISNYEKETRSKAVINNPIRAINYYYQATNNDLREIIKNIISNNYKPREEYYYEKEYVINDNNQVVEASFLEDTLRMITEEINNTLETRLTTSSHYTINSVKSESRLIKSELERKLREKGVIKRLSNYDKIIINKIRKQLNKIITYQPKTINNKVVIRLDSKDKIEQIRLLDKIKSCFSINHSKYNNSQQYLTTNRINFVGIYEDNKPIGRFTLVINPDNKEVGIVSKVYNNKLTSIKQLVNDWLKSFANKNKMSISYTIKLPIKEFYDDAGTTINGEIRTLSHNLIER